LRSTTPFCWGVYDIVHWWELPLSRRKVLNLCDMYSPPWSVQISWSNRILILCFHRINQCMACCIINEGNKVYMFAKRWRLDWATYITMNKLQFSWSISSHLWEKTHNAFFQVYNLHTHAF
jgi:hypothetical protein